MRSSEASYQFHHSDASNGFVNPLPNSSVPLANHWLPVTRAVLNTCFVIVYTRCYHLVHIQNTLPTRWLQVSITWLKTWCCYRAHKMLSLSSLAYSVFHIASYLPNICSHFFTGFIRDPTPHLNTLANLGEFIIIPSILKLN